MLFIANWKLNKTSEDIKPWIDDFNSNSGDIDFNKHEIIVAPSDVLLPFLFEEVDKSLGHVILSSQDISKFDSGAHTGETSALQLKSMVKYSIIGHSERRTQGDTNEDILLKIKNALANNIIPIVCFSNLEELNFLKNSGIDIGKCLFAYEPLYAIGTGNAADPQDVKIVFEKTGLNSMIYGGSVNRDTIKNYSDLNFINGFLIGSASLNPTEFSDTIKSALS